MKKIYKKLKLFRLLRRRKPIKLNVGSAGINQGDGWIPTDIDILDITKFWDWFNILFYRKVDNIMAEHVWEHLNQKDTKLANKNCFRFLNKGGRLRIAVPDGLKPDPDYIEYVRPGGCGAGADDHKILYNYKSLKESLEAAGFAVELLEFWDENERFHYKEWKSIDGHINRSKRFDKRNKDGELKYTSLIADAIKP